MKFLTVLMLYFICAVFLFAQEDESKQQSTEALKQISEQQEAPEIEDDENLKLFLDKIEIVGQLERPQAVFFLQNTPTDIDDINIKRSFFKDIFRPVEKKGRMVTKMSTEPTQDRKDYIPW
ncbi:hypothetical protein JW935_03180 [candidate division KSB1 bacterium]|nr:hypothetical protein [candidate division KSB1 bacterium]